MGTLTTRSRLKFGKKDGGFAFNVRFLYIDATIAKLDGFDLGNVKRRQQGHAFRKLVVSSVKLIIGDTRALG